MAEKRYICEIKISQVLGTDEFEQEILWESNIQPAQKDILTVIDMLRGVANTLEAEQTPIRRISPE